jgi:hypothetical protein
MFDRRAVQRLSRQALTATLAPPLHVKCHTLKFHPQPQPTAFLRPFFRYRSLDLVVSILHLLKVNKRHHRRAFHCRVNSAFDLRCSAPCVLGLDHMSLSSVIESLEASMHARDAFLDLSMSVVES